jgi:hypothetical protein
VAENDNKNAVPYKSGMTIDIKDSDKVVKYDDLFSYYKLVSFEIEKPQPNSIRIRSLCDCLGSYKNTLVPKLSLYDASYKSVNLKNVETNYVNAEAVNGKNYSASIIAKWVTDELSPGKYTLVVYADNSKAGEVVGTAGASTSLMPAGGNMFMPIGMVLNFSSYPLGQIILNINDS